MSNKKLAAKNLEALSELMYIEELAYKKADVYSGLFKDAALQRQCRDLADSHRSRFDALYSYLNSHE